MDTESTMDTESLDATVAVLRSNAERWARLAVADKVDALEGIVDRTDRVAEAWVRAAASAKGIPPDSPWVGEEWISGPWALITAASQYAESLRAIDSGTSPISGVGRHTRPDGRVVLDVFPANLYDRLLLNAYSAEVWMQPAVTEENLSRHVAPFYRIADPAGHVALVLGAGNISSIVPLDLLYKMFVEGAVGLVKMNPVNDYLGEHLEAIFAPLVAEGFVRFAYGAADVGGALCEHEGVDSIHITGSAMTHDTIVFGSDDGAAERKRNSDPVIEKPMTSELGGVGATILVPGPWDDGDIAYQAENLATMKLHNGGFNCIALQVVVLPQSWERTVELEDALAHTIRSLEPREPYYPGAGDRLASLLAGHPDAEQLDRTSIPRTLVRGVDPADTADACFTTEAFGGAMASTRLPGTDAASYLRAAVEFCNDTLDGTLGVQLLVHPDTIAELGPVLDSAIADLRYGTVGVNCWNGVGYLLQRTPWGAYPGHTLDDVGSGIGVVHNTYMLEDTEKAVVRGPFRTFPRSVGHRDLHLATKPPWFVTNRNAAVIGERLTHFAANPGLARLAALFPPALTG